jgi:hypothetical protein
LSRARLKPRAAVITPCPGKIPGKAYTPSAKQMIPIPFAPKVDVLNYDKHIHFSVDLKERTALQLNECTGDM